MRFFVAVFALLVAIAGDEHPAAADPPFAHVIVVIQENRSFDNLFHGFTGAQTVNAGRDHLNQIVALKPVGFQNSTDPNHGYADLVKAWNGGMMNGFDLTGSTGPPTLAAPAPRFPYAYVPQSQTRPYWTLAAHYALADHMFTSALTPTFPGHMFLISGQAPADDPSVPAAARGSWAAAGLPWGCTSPQGTVVALFNPDGTVSNPPAVAYPCFDYPSLGALLDTKNISWKYYANSDYPYDMWDGSVGAYVAIRSMYSTSEFAATNVPRYRFFSDVTSCKLPAVSYITPDGGASDHAGTFGWTAGPDWVSLIYGSIAQSPCPYYGNTAILVTWDDSGGWYDHVVPPLDSRGHPLGMRVPLLFIAANAKAHYVSKQQHDFGSILHFIESNFGLPFLSDSKSGVITRDVLADDLSDMWDPHAAAPVSPLTPSQLSSSAHSHTVAFYRDHQSLKSVDSR